MNPDMEKKYNLFHQIVMGFFFQLDLLLFIAQCGRCDPAPRQCNIVPSPCHTVFGQTSVPLQHDDFLLRTTYKNAQRTWRACADQRTRLFSSNIHVRIVSREIRQMLRNFIDTVLLCSTIIQRLFLLSLKQMKFVTNMTNGVTKRRNYPVEQGQDIHPRRAKQKLQFMEDCFLYKFENKYR